MAEIINLRYRLVIERNKGDHIITPWNTDKEEILQKYVEVKNARRHFIRTGRAYDIELTGDIIWTITVEDIVGYKLEKGFIPRT
jgi:hypothetical protein